MINNCDVPAVILLILVISTVFLVQSVASCIGECAYSVHMYL